MPDYWQRTSQLHPDVDPTQLDTDRMEQDRVGTSNIWWTCWDSSQTRDCL